ncbi:protein unc-93 homolog A [Microcaecilia unicolor]|uniref:Protein unc-93 homolog A n=1 Tax=Microcaecilia unicolor TaxID=1415580 RepID=A0A6P7XGP9_9AMPH|nr:protein unc-93 homolog A-like [Microcaecilia unicolor]XP_030052351.1 protein unc-93 homolog A-like [Microcaecilia unicolor]XP_030052352.1 protein unc-93 homolog A-like [Microcaecilia unicolor]
MGKHLKNILIISFGFLLLFTAFGGLQSLQSSLNQSEGLGVASLSVLYGALIFSSMFVPPVLIRQLGCKWTIALSMCCYVAYTLGNFYASWATLIPTSIILGLGGAPLWSAKCTYLTISGNQYAEKVGKLGKDIINQYFGIFFFIFQSSGVWGNLMSSLIFGQSPTLGESLDAWNYSHCGANDCPSTVNSSGNSTASNKPSDSLIYTLLGIYTGTGVLAVLLIGFFLDQIDHIKEKTSEKEKQSFWTTLFATFQQLRDKRQCLLIPLTMYSGLEQGFLAGDYTKSYVTCVLGIQFVGYVMICFAATNAVCSVLFGKLSQYTGRIALFALAAATNIACIAALLLWKPHHDQLAVFFVFPALWGMADAIWQTQTNALYGVLFDEHKEAAFANYRLWESLGFVIAYAYSTYLCVYVKLYIVLSVLIVSMVLYGLVEYQEHKKKPPIRCGKENKQESLPTVEQTYM